MKAELPETQHTVEPEEEIVPPSGHGKMPLILLLLWIANVAFFFFYFIKFGLPDLQEWLQK
jgi:hypothetical protein